MNHPGSSFAAYNEKVVLYLRQPTIDDLLKEKVTQYSSNAALRDKVHKIITHGTQALDRLSNDIDLILLLRYIATGIVHCLWGAHGMHTAMKVSVIVVALNFLFFILLCMLFFFFEAIQVEDKDCLGQQSFGVQLGTDDQAWKSLFIF